MWSAEKYLAFRDLRLRPALDLVARIPDYPVRTIVDLGCGPGNVAALLMQRWPDAVLTGIDSSAGMLARAREQWPSLRWIEADIAQWCPADPVDLVFSNAALHWLDGHPTVFSGFARMLTSNGVLAVQMPANFAKPSHRLVRELAKRSEWASHLHDVRMGAVLDAGGYHAILSTQFTDVDLWETTYVQALSGEDCVFEWLAGTTLLPYLSRLPSGLRELFCAALRVDLRKAYRMQQNGSIIFPFKRIFMVARGLRATVSRGTCS